MTRLPALLVATALWAVIYLPGLGVPEIHGEEGRRILPAVTMLDTGNWLVPYVGGKPFLRKPPLVNWAIAASFKLTGLRNEWTARLPSALCVLSLALTIVAVSSGRGWMNADTGLIAAIFAMTQFGLLAKARLAGAEIEGIYVPLCGIAMVCWLAWWSQARSPWLTWTVPFLFLGSAALAKAPLHLLFFYTIVVAVLWHKRALRELFSVAHLLGILIMAGIFAAWAIPYLRSEEAMRATQVWKDQFVGRITGNVFDWKTYLLNIPRGLMDQLPWLLFAPLLFVRRRVDERQRASDERAGEIVSPVFWAIIVSFVALLLIPGVLPRYVLPLGVPFCLIIAIRLGAEDERSSLFRRWHQTNRLLAALLLPLAIVGPFIVNASQVEPTISGRGPVPDFSLAIKAAFLAAGIVAVCVIIIARRPIDVSRRGVAVATGALFGLATLLYATAAMPWIKRGDNVRPVAAAIDAAIDASTAAERREMPGGAARLILFDPGWEPAIFYLRTRYAYAADVKDIPKDAEFVLTRAKDNEERVEQLERFARKRPELELARAIPTRMGEELLLLRRREAISKDGRR